MYLIKENIITNISIYRIIKYIKKSKINASEIGTNVSILYSVLYYNYNNNKNFNLQKDYYNLLIHEHQINHLVISKFLSKNINFQLFFTMLNKKVLHLDDYHIWNYLRGYYLNNLDLYFTNLNYNKEDYIFILYDYHYEYLLFIYTKIYKEQQIKNKMKLLLNIEFDKHIFNDNSNDLNYKLIFKHKVRYFNNSVKNILDLLFLNIDTSDQLINDDEKQVFNKYVNEIS